MFRFTDKVTHFLLNKQLIETFFLTRKRENELLFAL